MQASPQSRAERFRADIAARRLRPDRAGRDGVLLGLGIALMVAGTAITFLGYLASTATDTTPSGAADQTELLSLGFTGVCVTITGAAVFLRYAIARFLRFWLLRHTYDEHERMDRIVAAIRDRTGCAPPGS